MYEIKLAQEFNYNTEHNEVYILPNNKHTSITLLLRLIDEVRL